MKKIKKVFQSSKIFLLIVALSKEKKNLMSLGISESELFGLNFPIIF